MKLTKRQKAAKKRLLVTAKHCGTPKLKDFLEFVGFSLRGKR